MGVQPHPFPTALETQQLLSMYIPDIKDQSKKPLCNARNTSRGVQDPAGVGGGCAAHEQFVPESELSRDAIAGLPTAEGCSCVHCRPVRAGDY
jgi:hypothetical protein